MNVLTWNPVVSRVRSSLTAFFLCLLWQPAFLSSSAQGGDAHRIEDIRVGIEGNFKVGVWSPIRFRLDGPAGSSLPERSFRAEIVTADPDGQGCRIPLANATVSGDELSGLFCSWKLQAPLLIEVYEGESLVASRTVKVNGTQQVRCLKHEDQIWAIDGDQPVFAAARTRWQSRNASDFATVSWESVSQLLPPLGFSAESLEGLDGIVLNADTRISADVSEALRQFVQRGGRLILSVGADAEILSNSPLARWLPLMPIGQTETRYLTGINELVPGSATLRFLGTIPAAELDRTQGVTVASGLKSPLVQRAAYGTGTVTLSAVRLDRPPFSTWDETSAADLAVKLARLDPPWLTKEDQDSEEGFNPTGVSDLQTQLVHAVDSFEEVRRPSHQSVLLWLALYIVILGPLDYILVHHILKRPEWTWGTALILIVAAAALAISQGSQANQTSMTSRQIELLDFDVASGLARGRSVYSFYSPSTARREVKFRPGKLLTSLDNGQPPLFRGEWATRPEDGYRGMYSRGGTDLSKPASRFSKNRDSLTELPTLVWSSVSLESDWACTVSGAELASGQLQDNGTGRLTGVVTSELPEPIEDWFLAYGDFMYFPDRNKGESEPLQPGKPFQVSSLNSNLLRGRLVGLTMSSEKISSSRTSIILERASHDPWDRDAESIFRTITFHEAMGGTDYTGLTNSVLATADLSDLLKLHRAVVFGRIRTPSTRLTIDGVDDLPGDSQVFVRLILPVEFQNRDGDLLPSQDLLQAKP
ncbi:MAG: hypothetical protein KDA80_12805 [Planctomycetaceae bacterium]|nr:hypothetical protein [Planctomycetaceae bacterium]